MKKQLGFATSIIIVLTLTGNYFGIINSAFSQDINVNNDLVFSIPLGENGIHYEGTDNPDAFIWGPPAFTIAPDGTFWIADTPDDHLLQFTSKGMLLSKIAIGDFTIGAGDLEVTSSDIWVLDKASIPPKVVRLTLEGKIISTHDLPKGLWLEDGLSGIDLGSDDSVLVERLGGHAITQFVSSEGEIKLNILKGYDFQGKLFSAYPANMREKEASQGYILAGEKRIDVTVANDLGGLSVLYVNPDNSFYVNVVELVLNKSFQVDQKVYYYNADGELLGMARIPLEEQYIPVEHGIVVGPDSKVYALITKPDGAEVQRLSFFTELPAILQLPVEKERSQQFEELSITAETCRDREAMIDVAEVFE